MSYLLQLKVPGKTIDVESLAEAARSISGAHLEDQGEMFIVSFADSKSLLQISPSAVASNYPDEPMFHFLLRLARKTKARITGDEGESYSSIRDYQARFSYSYIETIRQEITAIVAPLAASRGYEVVPHAHSLIWTKDKGWITFVLDIHTVATNQLAFARWGFRLALVPDVGSRSVIFTGKRRAQSFDYVVSPYLDDVDRAAGVSFAKGKLPVGKIRTMARDALKALDKLESTAVDLESVDSLVAECINGSADHPELLRFSYAFVLIAKGKKSEGLRKAASYLRTYDIKLPREKALAHVAKAVKRIPAK